MSELTRYEQPVAIQRLNVAETVQAIVKAGLTADAAAAIKELVHLQNQQEDRLAAQDWTRAFTEARTKCKTIQADTAVEIQGKVAWDYAKLPSLLDAIEPICEPLGLSISFDSARDGPLVTGICIVYHTSGHSERRQATMTLANAMGKIPDMGAITTCQRKALCLMFGLKVRKMDEGDPRMLGDFISPEDAAELESRCAELGSEKYTKALLKFAHAETFGDVYSAKLAGVRASLTKAESNLVAFRAKFTDAKSPHEGGATVPTGAPPIEIKAADIHEPQHLGSEKQEKSPNLSAAQSTGATGLAVDAGAVGSQAEPTPLAAGR